MQENDREKYEQFYVAFGAQLKWGIYNDYGMHKDVLQNLIMFKSSHAGNVAHPDFIRSFYRELLFYKIIFALFISIVQSFSSTTDAE